MFERRTGEWATGRALATNGTAGLGGSSANADDARAALAGAEIDQNGIGPRHQRILGVLRRYRRAIGVRRLASEAGLTEQAYRTLYEPVLIRSRAVEATRWGLRLGEGAPAASGVELR
jgi:Holliday junction resolvasome RuvABC ATP-dependent DNA helicase subunit